MEHNILIWQQNGAHYRCGERWRRAHQGRSLVHRDFVTSTVAVFWAFTAVSLASNKAVMLMDCYLLQQMTMRMTTMTMRKARQTDKIRWILEYDRASFVYFYAF